VTGATGRPGEAGPQGPIGSTGAQGPAGVVDRWTSYRDFWFDQNSAALHASESNKVSEVANYMKTNPSLKVGIDGAMARNGSDARARDLNDGRVNAVSAALMAAGVPKNRIETGAFGNAKLARDGRVEVLLRTIE
jgi:outer membrane protein OmpA-like peptidoglycan-associated protein